jgi:predicted RNA-binding protein with PUA-like domain
VDRSAELLRVIGAAGFESLAKEFTRMLAPPCGKGGLAPFKERCGSVIHAERLSARARNVEWIYPAAESSITIAAMEYFLFKTEPGVYSFDDFEGDQETTWDGVTNPTAVKHLRELKPGTKWIFYHTGDERTAVGTGTVVSVDSSDPKVPIVKVKVGKRLKHPRTLAEIKAEPLFAKSPLILIGRLSVVPLTEEQWDWFLS